VLNVRDLVVGYGSSRALEGVELHVDDGEFVALLGRNGMGKTSLCRSIMSLTPPQAEAGSISYGETELLGRPPHQVARAGLGYVPQGRHVFPTLTVVDNLTVAQRNDNGAANGDAWDLDRIWEVFPRLHERRTNEGGQLSGGEQQMLAIARALMTNPTLLLMDEPSEGLAPLIVESLGHQLQELKGGALSLLLVEQNYNLAISLADRVYVMENGQVVFEGTPEALDGDEGVKRRYLGVGV